MGRLYLDATGNYSNPAETSYKYLRADGEWATPDMDHKWLDAAGEYTVPELGPPIYGVRFSSFPQVTKGIRTDAAESFSDPKPAVKNGSGSSPFDNIYPWSEMKVEERAGGKMVKIPKFYYKLTQDGNGVDVQIAGEPADGFSVSPTHINRNDGKGERNAVYVGRYHCATKTYKSTTGALPVNQTAGAEMNANCQKVGNNCYMMDFATRSTIWLLYLVEFAEWNSDKTIGLGGGDSTSPQNMGYTDNMAYCTGTSLASASVAGFGTQYRYIEGLWDNVYDILSGCYSVLNSGLYVITDTSKLADTSGGELACPQVEGYVGKLTVSEVCGFPMFYPSVKHSGGSQDTGTCDYWTVGYSATYNTCGGYFAYYSDRGLFCINGSLHPESEPATGCRLMELP